MRNWDRVIAYLELLSLDPAHFGKTCAYLLECMTNGVHKTFVTAAAIVAGVVYTPTLAAIEKLQDEGLDGMAQLAFLCQWVVEWALAVGQDATDVFMLQIQLFEDEVYRAPETLQSAIRSVAMHERRGAHNPLLFVIEPEVKELVEEGFREFARTMHHHTARLQEKALDVSDPAWKRAGGQLANMTDAQLRKCENALFTGSSVESMQGTRVCVCAARELRVEAT